MIEKLKTLVWFALRPNHWAHARALIIRKFEKNRDTTRLRSAATEWSAQQAVSVEQALARVGLATMGTPIPILDPNQIRHAMKRAKKSQVKMGGSGDLRLLYAVTKLGNVNAAVETGVAYGWSSLAILSAMSEQQGARLISIDMPYPKMNNEKFVGIVLADEFRPHWTLIREPDRHGISKAISLMGRPLDLVHYDSDKSWQGRCYGYPILWDALRSGGIFISDDIQDNMAFREFMEQKGVEFAVTESEGKYIGITRKP